MTEFNKNPKNQVQASHHQLIPIEALEQSINDNRAIGTNDIISYVLRKVSPGVAAPLAHSLSYLLRLGGKDDPKMEIEKCIWWLMDAHNRLSDERGEEREFAPWVSTGKKKDFIERKVQKGKRKIFCH